MRLQTWSLLVPLATGLVITEQSVYEKLGAVEESGRQFIHKTQDVLDQAFGKTKEIVQHATDDAYDRVQKFGYDVDSWLEGSPYDESLWEQDEDHPHHPPHHGKPPHHGDPHHPPHHEKPNMTIYELISKSKYTTKFAELINEHEDLVQLLNDTKANHTIFAPTDSAFDKIPEHHKKPSKEFIKGVLLYHIAPGCYPAGRVLHSYTIPSLFEPSDLGHKQRLTVRVTLRGPAINFYSRLVATNIFATNGVIHGVDSILAPPPAVATIINLLPGEFSTLELALVKTGLFEKMNSTDYPHKGGTLFAPSNFAFKKLGPRVNAFLFSKYGTKYLKALLEYHMVVDQTLYSDAFFDATSDEQQDATGGGRPAHYDLPSVLGKNLAVDVARYGPFVEMRINAFSRVTIHDGVASDGVIQVVSNVLIPPKSHDGEDVWWEGEEMSVEEFKERVEPLVEEENMEL
jgi:uncharacterized surface protein with fasciclin (FAS1) repeats